MEIKKEQILQEAKERNRLSFAKLFFNLETDKLVLEDSFFKLENDLNYKKLCEIVGKKDVDTYLEIATSYLKDLAFFKHIGRYNQSWEDIEWISGEKD